MSRLAACWRLVCEALFQESHVAPHYQVQREAPRTNRKLGERETQQERQTDRETNLLSRRCLPTSKTILFSTFLTRFKSCPGPKRTKTGYGKYQAARPRSQRRTGVDGASVSSIFNTKSKELLKGLVVEFPSLWNEIRQMCCKIIHFYMDSGFEW